MRSGFVLLWFNIFSIGLFAQYQLSGIITDSITREPIVNVYIEILEINRSALSDHEGNYTIKDIPPGNYTIRMSHLAYQNSFFSISLMKDLVHDQILSQAIIQMTPVEIIHHWSSQDAPIPQVRLDEKALEKYNTGQDLPYLIRNTPSLVTTSDAGHGVGYTGMRIRGSDATRINVTINGVPLNDSESQNVFWVDLPDFGSSINNLQIQRGVGSSTHGAGAFGASINLNTQGIHTKPYVSTQHTIGSFNTRQHNLELSSGILNENFTLESRLSTISSDGYIDRASVNLNSYYLAGTYFTDNQSLSFLTFGGKERTYQAWNGVPAQYIRDPGLRKFNTAGTERSGEPHPDEVDDYDQKHYQLVYKQRSDNWDWNATLHLTRGKGFFEQYKADQSFSDYSINCGSLNVEETDLIRRRWLDNYFYGGLFSISKKNPKGVFTAGTAINRYEGRHFGEVVWAQFSCNTSQGQLYYDNDAVKNDANIYVKYQWLKAKWKPFLDLQYRYLDYQFLGLNDDGNSLEHQVSHHFFNPKGGIQFVYNEHTKFNLYIGVAHKEPNRDDYTEANPKSWPSSEVLYDVELGVQSQNQKLSWDANLYYMFYKNQLVLNGEINDVGAYTRINIDKSYRFGLEFNFVFPLSSKLIFAGNATLSRNRIPQFTEFVDDWGSGTQIPIDHKNTRIAFSPDFIGFQKLDYHILGFENSAKRLTISIENKYVGKQYLDNTQNKLASLNAYFVSDLFLAYHWRKSRAPGVRLFAQVRNLFNRQYSSNGWVYRFKSSEYNPIPEDPYAREESSSYYHLAGYYPQATRNYVLGVQLNW